MESHNTKTKMTTSALFEATEQGIKAAVAEASERHRKLGESIAIWRDCKVVTLTGDEIPKQSSSETCE